MELQIRIFQVGEHELLHRERAVIPSSRKRGDILVHLGGQILPVRLVLIAREGRRDIVVGSRESGK